MSRSVIALFRWSIYRLRIEKPILRLRRIGSSVRSTQDYNNIRTGDVLMPFHIRTQLAFSSSIIFAVLRTTKKKSSSRCWPFYLNPCSGSTQKIIGVFKTKLFDFFNLDGNLSKIFPIQAILNGWHFKITFEKNGEYSYRCDKSFSELFLVELVHQLAE